MKSFSKFLLEKQRKVIAIDFDKTLSRFDSWHGKTVLGEPIPKMVERVKEWHKEGITVVIFTARGYDDENKQLIQDWCEKHIGFRLTVMNIKRRDFSEFWDDKAIEVIPNTGKRAK